MRRYLAVLALAATAFGATISVAQAGKKTVSFSICAGSNCENNASQHNFTHPGAIKVSTHLPAAMRVKAITYSCAAFCSNGALWPIITLSPGKDATYVTLDARHVESINDSSTARSNIYTINISIHY